MFLLAAITAATLFLNGAEIHQTEALSLAKGMNEIRVEGLSPSLNPSSIQLSLTGGAVITSSQFITDYLSSSVARHDDLEQTLVNKKALLTELTNQAATNLTSLSLLESGVRASMSYDRVTTATVDANLKFYQSKAADLYAQKITLDNAIDKTKEEIKTLEAQIKESSTQGKTRSGVLLLTISSPKAQRQPLEIRYFTPEAAWSMHYDINVKAIGKPIELVKKAHVSQTTGLDWSAVRLTLSTATPMRNNQAPELSTWFINKYEQPLYFAARAAKVANASFAAMDNMVFEEEAEMATMDDFITTTKNEVALEYHIDVPYDVQGNGKEQIIALGTETLANVDYAYYVVPKVNTDVFLIADLSLAPANSTSGETTASPLALLPGEASIHYNGTYFGETYLNTNALHLTLGTDPSIRVKREKVQDLTATKGSTTSQALTYRTSITNTKTTPVKLIVKDQYPVSQNKDIKVSLSDKTTAGAANDTERGLLTYTLSLSPAETQSLLLDYTLRYPKDWTIR